MSPQQGQLLNRLPHCTKRRELGLEWSCLTYAVRHTCCGLDMLLLCMQCVEECLCMWDMQTCTTQSPMLQRVFISHSYVCMADHDRHVTPSFCRSSPSHQLLKPVS